MSAAVKDNIKSRVCILAGTSLHLVEADAAAFLERRANKWLESRKVRDADLEKAAIDMKRRYPRSIPAVAPHAQAAAPVGGSLKPAQAQALKRAASVTLPPAHKGSAVASPSPAAATPTPTQHMSWRPAVLQRMQSVSANHEWQVAIQKDLDKYEAEQEQLRQEKQKKRQQIQRDMQVAEQYRLQRVEEERKEREDNRKIVISVIEEVKQLERDQHESRREKFAAEKKQIEEQREMRRLVKEKEARERKRENERLRQFITEDIKRHTQDEYEKAVAVRDSLLMFLQQSTEFMDVKRRAAEEQKLLEHERDVENLSKGVGSVQVSILSDQRIKSLKEKKVKAQVALQAYVSNQYTALEKARQERQKEEEARMWVEVERKNREAELRNAADMAHRMKQREVLVSALDLEVQIREQRKAEAEREKVALRSFVDQDTDKYHHEQESHKMEHLSQQRELLKKLDVQVEQSFHRSMRPPQLKITSQR